MPISGEDFDKGIAQLKILDLLEENRSKAFSLAELNDRFGSDTWIELDYLILQGLIEVKNIATPQGKSLYFKLKD